jgi:hypothetical protein
VGSLPDEQAALGAASAEELAEARQELWQLMGSASGLAAVLMASQRARIEAEQLQRLWWTPRPDVHPQPAAASDAEVAAAHGVLPETVATYRAAYSLQVRKGRPPWQPSRDVLPLPGQDTDRAVATAHGVTLATVRHYRKRHSIDAVRGRGRPCWQPDPSISPQPGQASARAVAAAHGVSPTTVSAYLRKCNQL